MKVLERSSFSPNIHFSFIYIASIHKSNQFSRIFYGVEEEEAEEEEEEEKEEEEEADKENAEDEEAEDEEEEKEEEEVCVRQADGAECV